MHGSAKYFLLLVALLAGAVFFACGGDDDDEDDGGNGSEPTAAETTENGDGDGDEDADGDSGDTSEELSDLAEQFGIVEVRVSYTFSTSGAGEAFDGTMTFYSRPPDSWRMDLSSADGEFTMINTGGVSYLCSEEGGQGSCFESPLTEAISVPFFNLFADPAQFETLIDEELSGADVDRSEREIAGQDAICYSASGTVDGETGEGEYCFREDGVLLFLQGSGDGTGSIMMEATEVSDTVEDSDLEPPYEILDLGDVPGLP